MSALSASLYVSASFSCLYRHSHSLPLSSYAYLCPYHALSLRLPVSPVSPPFLARSLSVGALGSPATGRLGMGGLRRANLECVSGLANPGGPRGWVANVQRILAALFGACQRISLLLSLGHYREFPRCAPFQIPGRGRLGPRDHGQDRTAGRRFGTARRLLGGAGTHNHLTRRRRSAGPNWTHWRAAVVAELAAEAAGSSGRRARRRCRGGGVVGQERQAPLS